MGWRSKRHDKCIQRPVATMGRDKHLACSSVSVPQVSSISTSADVPRRSDHAVTRLHVDPTSIAESGRYTIWSWARDALHAWDGLLSKDWIGEPRKWLLSGVIFPDSFHPGIRRIIPNRARARVLFFQRHPSAYLLVEHRELQAGRAQRGPRERQFPHGVPEVG